MTKKLSASLEDYLEAIAELCAAEGHAHSKEIAQKLSVKMPSVTKQHRSFGYLQTTSTSKTLISTVAPLTPRHATPPTPRPNQFSPSLDFFFVSPTWI